MPAWKKHRATGGGVLLDLGSQHVDLLRWLLDDEIAGVAARITSDRSEQDTAWLRCTMARGAEAHGFFSFNAGRTDFVEVIGERGTIRVDRHRAAPVLQLARRPATACGARSSRRASTLSGGRSVGWRGPPTRLIPPCAPGVRRGRAGETAQVATLLDGWRSLKRFWLRKRAPDAGALVTDWNRGQGGAEASITWLRDGLRAAGDETRLLTSGAGTAGNGTADFVAFGTENVVAQAFLQIENPIAYVTARQAVREFRPDVAWVNMFAHHLSPAVLRALRQVPTVLLVSDYKCVCPLGSKLLPDGSLCQSRAGWACHEARCLSLPHWLRDQPRYASFVRSCGTSLAWSPSVLGPAELAAAGIPADVLLSRHRQPPQAFRERHHSNRCSCSAAGSSGKRVWRSSCEPLPVSMPRRHRFDCAS